MYCNVLQYNKTLHLIYSSALKWAEKWFTTALVQHQYTAQLIYYVYVYMCIHVYMYVYVYVYVYQLFMEDNIAFSAQHCTAVLFISVKASPQICFALYRSSAQ